MTKTPNPDTSVLIKKSLHKLPSFQLYTHNIWSAKARALSRHLSIGPGVGFDATIPMAQKDEDKQRRFDEDKSYFYTTNGHLLKSELDSNWGGKVEMKAK